MQCDNLTRVPVTNTRQQSSSAEADSRSASKIFPPTFITASQLWLSVTPRSFLQLFVLPLCKRTTHCRLSVSAQLGYSQLFQYFQADCSGGNRKSVKLGFGLPCQAHLSLYVPLMVTMCTANGHCMYHQFNFQQFYVLPTQCIYVFCVDLRTNSDYFPIQH